MLFSKSITRAVHVLPLAALASCQDTFSTLYHFPNSPFVDIENAAVRSNGQILLDTITGANTYLFDPNSSNPPQLIATYPNAESSLGITETLPDLFAVVTGNYSQTSFQGVEGSFAIYSLDLRSGLPAKVKKVASIPTAQALNGATTITNNPVEVLIADSGLGAIWKLNINSGQFSQALQSSAFTPNANIPLGINGVRYHQNYVYYTNSAQGTFGKVAINDAGIITGTPTVIATPLSTSYTYDDLAIDSAGNAYIMNHPNQISKVTPAGVQTLIENGSAFDQPSSAVFARTGPASTLYVVTGGTPGTDSGSVVAVST